MLCVNLRVEKFYEHLIKRSEKFETKCKSPEEVKKHFRELQLVGNNPDL